MNPSSVLLTGKPEEGTIEESEYTDADDDDLDIVPTPWVSMPEDVYGAGTTAIIKDMYFVMVEHDRPLLRTSRLTLSVGLIAFMIGLQIYCVFMMKHLVTGRAAYDAAKTYNEYKKAAYDEAGNFNRGHFIRQMTHDEKGTLCAIPLTHPGFFGCILFIWAFTVSNNLRDCLHYCLIYVRNTPTVNAYEEMLKSDPDDPDKLLIVGLTALVKSMIVIFMVSPRIVVNVALLILGSRWLMATFDWGELLLNAVALEFILSLKDVIYLVTVSRRMQVDMQNLQSKMFDTDRVYIDVWTTFRAFFFFAIAGLFAPIYMHYQTVLPGFWPSQEQQDLRSVCELYFKDTTASLF